MKISEVIAAHTNTDFDALAGMVAAGKLYPKARICLSGALNQNVRAFCALHAQELPTVDSSHVDRDAVRRLILIETTEANRLGELGSLLSRPDIEVIAFDHHRPGVEQKGTSPRLHVITTDDGALTTLMLRIIAERGLSVTPLEATVFALGIHEDTGSLTFPGSTQRDAEALAFCMRQGASPALIERFLHHPLSDAQRDLLARSLREAEAIGSPSDGVMVAAFEQAEYVEEIAVVAHRYLDVTGCAAFFLLVCMESRVFVVARSRSALVDVGAALRELDGGGHATAAAAVVRDAKLADVRRAVLAGVAAATSRTPIAADLMSSRIVWVDAETSVEHALLLCRREAVAGVPVTASGRVVGTVSEADLRRAIGHDLGHAPVKAIMTSGIAWLEKNARLGEVVSMVTASPIGLVPVVLEQLHDKPTSLSMSDVAGVIERGGLARALRGNGHAEPARLGPNVGKRLTELGLDDLLSHVQAVATEYSGVYLVGGAVRDLLLHERSFDIDIAVEGDGIEFAQTLARQLGGHVRAHHKFQTAVVIAAEQDGEEALRVDVASTRTEFYDFPAALPTVEHATLRADLARRDFTMNAMAVSLRSEDLGTLHDYFGGIEDLNARRIVVLHNLSFIEDPTRIFRALRYESRYGLRMDAHTHNLAVSCSEMHLIGDLSSARLRDELVLLLREPVVDFALQRMDELRIGGALHPKVSVDATTRDLVRASDALWRHHALAAEVPLWRLRLLWLLRDLTSEEIAAWCERMRFARADASVLARAWLVGQRLSSRVARGLQDATLLETASAEPLEAVLAAMVETDDKQVIERLTGYLEHTRFVRLEVDGDDLLALGFPESPAVGHALRSLLRLKTKGALLTRDDELEAAKRLL